MSHPTYRERTLVFQKIRDSNKRRLITEIPSVSSSEEPATSLLPTHAQRPHAPDSHVMMNMTITPSWMQCIHVIDHNLTEMKHQINELSKLYQSRQRVFFDEDQERQFDADIHTKTEAISGLLRASKLKLQEIGILNGSESGTAGFEERTARYNAMRSRALKLQEYTKLFRDTQRRFLQIMRSKQDKEWTHRMNRIAEVPDLSMVRDGFNEEQIAVLEEMEQTAKQNERQVLEIARSTHELAQLFEELSILIVEQGSVLDRIDYNVEETVRTLQETQPVIQSADKYQRKSKSALCILVLLLLIIVMSLLLVLKHAMQ